MKKQRILKVTVFTMPMLLGIIFSGCKTDNVNNVDVSNGENQEIDLSITDNMINDATVESESVYSGIVEDLCSDDNVDFINSNLRLDSITDFSEGRAWVQFFENQGGIGSSLNGNKAAVIDAQGKIVWESEVTKSNIVLRDKSEFRDGVAYFIFEGNDKSSYNIIDSEGTVTFTREYDENYRILGHGDGIFLIAEHIINFDVNEWRIGGIDKNGNTVAPFQVYEIGTSSTALDLSRDYYSCKYLGEGIYRLNFADWYVLLNIDAQSIIYVEIRQGEGHIEKFITDFEDGFATVLYDDDKVKDVGVGINPVWITTRTICSLGTDGTLAQIASNDWIQYSLRDDLEFSEGLAFISDSHFGNPEGGFVFSENLSTGAYYNIVGEKIIDFPKYYGTKPYYCFPFHNGYALMTILGADGGLYMTSINRQGEEMFDPIPCYQTVYMSSDGKYITTISNGIIAVFDVMGNPLVDINYKEITPRQGYTTLEYNVCDGVIRVDDFYVNVENGKIIGWPLYADDEFSVIMYKDTAVGEDQEETGIPKLECTVQYDGISVSQFFVLPVGEVVELLGPPIDGEINLIYDDIEFGVDRDDGRITSAESFSLGKFTVNGDTLEKGRDELIALIGNPVDEREGGSGHELEFSLEGCRLVIAVDEDVAWRIWVLPPEYQSGESGYNAIDLSYRGESIANWIGGLPENAYDVFGWPDSGTIVDGYLYEGGEYFGYTDGVLFVMDYQTGQITWIIGDTGSIIGNGYTLDKTRDELIEILGTPMKEGYAYNDMDDTSSYYMQYTLGNVELLINMPDAASRAETFIIS